ncbi:2-C-methyl-D-erythritol 4-phosphate cytidylyltransferase [bacterium HR10]|nr:2-C-methyl-D-erythritol 4-phosphate cytidylyltransferase [bacterium HR10]
MGAEVPKAFLPLLGEPILLRALRPFEACADVHRVLVVVPEELRSRAEAMLGSAPLTKLEAVIAGGPERAHSVFRALRAIPHDVADILLVHDGVRPFVTPEEIARVIARARTSGAAILAVPIAETVKEVEDERIVATLDRRRLYLAQTPQAFRATILREAYERAMREGIVATDDAALVERCGWPVVIVEGSVRNLKITWPEDLFIAEALLRAREGG